MVRQLQHIWDFPFRYFLDDLEIIIIGFSMRSDDYHIGAFIYPQLVQGSRLGSLTVKVIDYVNTGDPSRDEKEKAKIIRKYRGIKNCKFWFEGFNEASYGFINS